MNTMLPFTVITVALCLLGNYIVDPASGFSPSPATARLYLRDANGDSADGAVSSGDDGGDDDDDARTLFLVSDGTGATIKTSAQRSIAQFDVARPVRTRLFTFVRGEDTAASIIQAAKRRGAMVMSTIRVRALREKILRMCELEGVPAVDLLGPSLDGLESYLEKLPVNVPTMYDPGAVRVLGSEYYRRIDALQFTLRADDGQAPWLLKDADVVLVGVSRSGKTPLSVTVSQSAGLKVANVPLVWEVPPPRELVDSGIDPGRVFCLTISPSELKRIRATRLEKRLKVTAMEDKLPPDLLGDSAKSNYADRNYILRDLKNAHELKEKYGWTQIDVTGRAVEDTASQISELMTERFGDMFEDSKSGNFISLN